MCIVPAPFCLNKESQAIEQSHAQPKQREREFRCYTEERLRLHSAQLPTPPAARRSAKSAGRRGGSGQRRRLAACRGGCSRRHWESSRGRPVRVLPDMYVECRDFIYMLYADLSVLFFFFFFLLDNKNSFCGLRKGADRPLFSFNEMTDPKGFENLCVV